MKEECCCVISFAPHFTFFWKGDLQLELRLQPGFKLKGLNAGKQRREAVVVWIEWPSHRDVHYQIQ